MHGVTNPNWEGTMFRKRLGALVMVGALAVTACEESLGPEGNASQEDRDEIISLLDESGFFAEEFGVDGTYDGGAAGAPAAVAAAEAAEVVAPLVWGRRLGRPVRRVVTVDVDPEQGIATVYKEVYFEGRFLLDITQDGQFNPTEKPLDVKLVQYATFQHLPADQADAAGRRWRLVNLSPAEWLMTADDKQTVNLTRVEVWVNGVLQLGITDASELLDIDGRIPRLHVDDMVEVRAWVENSLDNGNEPDTFVFLHLFHASPSALGWLRLPMERVVTDTDVYYVLSWTARHIGRSRIAVDAIDAETFTTEIEDDYRSNIWGVPYRIEPLEGDI
jgi:hypothetical protein